MVKLRGEALSLGASGTLRDAITFSKWKGRGYLRARVKGANPKSPAQTSMRAVMKFLTTAWATLTDDQKATWQQLAAAANLPPYNAFIAENVRQWREDNCASKSYPAQRTSERETHTIETAVQQERLAKLTYFAFSSDYKWATALYRRLAGDPGPVWTYAIALFVPVWDEYADYLDGPLAPGTYYYTMRAAQVDGAWGYPAPPVSVTIV